MTGVQALLLVLLGIDAADDLRRGSEPDHLVLEGAILLTIAGAVTVSLARCRLLVRKNRSLEATLDETRAQAHRWQHDAEALLAGLGEAIGAQFSRWGLSPAEQAVALLLLKGLSHKEIGSLRGVSERTVRQQAQSVYRKGGLEGRTNLAAFFLEDLLLPHSRPNDSSEHDVAGGVSPSRARRRGVR
ncbi:MAG: response regulator transcription factor [Deltaproteobacteria bacterium]|nr:response regulator transcription factor [Deltaproteobacteria bacterium]